MVCGEGGVLGKTYMSHWFGCSVAPRDPEVLESVDHPKRLPARTPIR